MRWAIGCVLGALGILGLGLANGTLLAWPWAEHTPPGNVGYVIGWMTPGAIIGACIGGYAFRKSPDPPS